MPILSALLFALAPVAIPTAPPGAATLVVYRVHAEPILFAPNLLVDGKDFGPLGQKRLLAFALRPGRHHLEVKWPPYAAQYGAELDIVAIPDGRSYVALTGETRAFRQRQESSLTERDRATGEVESRCCHPPR